MYKCKYCGKEFKKNSNYTTHEKYYCEKNLNRDVERGDKVKRKQRESSIKSSIKRSGEYKLFKVHCHKCGKEFEVREREKLFPKKEKYFCSRSCANSHIITKETREKTATTLKKRVKEKGKWGGLKHLRLLPRILKICPVCNKEFEVVERENKKIYCSRECYYKDAPIKYRRKGYNPYSITYNHGYINGIFYQSSWELAYLTWCFDKGIEVKRYEGHFEYINSKGEIRKYYPDFYLPKYDLIVEIKGPQDKEWKNKKKGLPKETRLKVIDLKNIHFYLNRMGI